MGCGSSRKNMSIEEAKIYNGEQKLFYSDIDISHLFKVTLRNSTKGLVFKDQFKQIAKKLNLAIYIEDACADNKIARFYKDFLNDRYYLLRDLIEIAVLLTCGEAFEKAKFLFLANQDPECPTLNKLVVANIFDRLFEIAIEKLPMLASDDDPNIVSEEEMNVYLERAKMGRETCKNDIIKGMFGNETNVQLKDFCQWFDNEAYQDFLSSTGMRETLRKLGKNDHKTYRKSLNLDKINEKDKNTEGLNKEMPIVSEEKRANGYNIKIKNPEDEDKKNNLEASDLNDSSKVFELYSYIESNENSPLVRTVDEDSMENHFEKIKLEI